MLMMPPSSDGDGQGRVLRYPQELGVDGRRALRGERLLGGRDEVVHGGREVAGEARKYTPAPTTTAPTDQTMRPANQGNACLNRRGFSTAF